MTETDRGSGTALSVVVPLLDEEAAVALLFGELFDVLERLGRSWEVIAVDDGSRDATFARLAEIQAKEPRLRVLRFRRNFGQTAALAAGFEIATGEVVVTMDGDLQNCPEDIPALLEALEAGTDVVSGWRRERQDEWLSRIVPSRVANGMISRVTGVPLHDYGCGLKAYRRSILSQLRLYGEMHRFLPAIAASVGGRVVEIPVGHRPRTLGRSKYGITRTTRVLLDLITVKFLSDFSTRPIHVFGLLGLIASLSGAGLLAILGAQRIFLGVELGGRPIVLLAIVLLVTGLQFITFGLLGEMLARTYHESQGKPVYIVDRKLDATDPESTR